MITLYLIYKLTELIVKTSLWLLFLPLRLLLLPFRLLFRKSQRNKEPGYDDGFWEGLLIGGLIF